MKLNRQDARVFVPDGTEQNAACKRISHLAVGAHQDDLEIMAYDGIAACFGRDDQWFGGVTCTDGRGSPRSGIYEKYTDDDMVKVRLNEQDKAAVLGEYGIMLQLGHPSRDVKAADFIGLKEDLVEILKVTQPETVYTHNPADKHETHIAVFVSLLQAIRALPENQRPTRVLGCEVWRGLDWMPDSDKVALNVSAHPNLFRSLVGVFDSQITGGKRYDLATVSRACANATYYESHHVDDSAMYWFAMDLTPLARDVTLDPVAYVDAYLETFRNNVREMLTKRLGR